MNTFKVWIEVEELDEDGDRKRSKGGRLTMEELEWIVSLNPLMQDKAMEEKA